MKKPEQISTELKNNQWPAFSSHPFIDEVLFKTVYQQIKDDDEVVSQLWGIRINEKGELTSQYELLTLTTNHIISVYSDLNNEEDKVHVFSQPLKEVSKFYSKPSNLHKGYSKININLNGISWTIETNDLQTADHFNQELDKLLVKAKQVKEDEIATSLLNDDPSNHSLKTVHSEFFTKTKKRAKERNKKNVEAIRKYAKNNILWYSIIVLSSFFLITIASTYLLIISENPIVNDGLGGLYVIYSKHTTSLTTAGIFAIIFSVAIFTSFVMLTIKIWDKEKFSRNLYRVLIQLIFSIILIIFGFLMATKLTITAYVCALYMLPMAIFLMADSGYLLVKATHDLKNAKKVTR